jgi:hypothetical protein
LRETRQLVDDVLAEFTALMSVVGEVRAWNKTLRKSLIRSRAEALHLSRRPALTEDNE